MKKNKLICLIFNAPIYLLMLSYIIQLESRHASWQSINCQALLFSWRNTSDSVNKNIKPRFIKSELADSDLDGAHYTLKVFKLL